MLGAIKLLGKLSRRYTSVVGKGEHCWPELPVLHIMLCYYVAHVM